MSRRIEILPSILSCDFGRLAEEIQAAEAAGADRIHVDVMDGRYVPNLTIGPVIVEAAKRAATVPLDVHLMIVQPELWLEHYRDAGADTLTVHEEASTHLHSTLQNIRKLGMRAGVALNPHTSQAVLEYVLPELDHVLVMSVNPGFGGQAFISNVVPKIRKLRAAFDSLGRPEVDIAVDGGISEKTAGLVAKAGANLLVAGSAIFNSPNYAQAIQKIRAAAQAG